MIAPGWESAPASDSGHPAVIVGGGGGQTYGGHPVTEHYGAGQLDNCEVIIEAGAAVTRMNDPLGCYLLFSITQEGVVLSNYHLEYVKNKSNNFDFESLSEKANKDIQNPRKSKNFQY